MEAAMGPGSLDPDSVRELVRREFETRQSILLEEIKSGIELALKCNQKAIVLTGGQTSEKKPRTWEWAQIIIPALLTGAVGLGVWYTQTTLSDKITSAAQAVSTRYLLRQEYEKDKFKAYQRTMQRLTILENTISGATFGSNGRARAIAAKNDFDNEIDASEFYFTPELYQQLNKVSEAASMAKGINPLGGERPEDVRVQIAAVKEAIRKEVRGELAVLSDPKP
jgi:hypothetical protein